MKEIFNLFFIYFCVATLTAQTFNVEKMDSLFSAVEENNKGMGSFSLFQDGEEIYQNSIGYADIQQKIKANAETKYRIGSISKTFTAAIIMQLGEEGKLRLDTKLLKFYPELPNADKISIEDLLRHQSGLFNFTDAEDYKSYMEQPKTKQELLEIFKSQEPVFEPGSKNEYSNTNYVLLTFIAEDITGRDYAQLLQDRIAKPLGLENTYYGGKINTAKAEAQSYKKEKGWVPATETDMSIPQGAGAVVSTSTDLNKFISALFNGKLVKPESLEKMKNIENGYGMGLFSYPFFNKTFYGHPGGIDGFSSMVIYNIEDKLAVTYISNGTDMPTSDLLVGALNIYYGRDYAIPFGKTLDIPAEELQKFSGTYGSETFPLKVKIFVEDDVLKGQATGQPSFPLEAYESDKFQFTRAGLQLEFTPEEDKMLLLQNGATYELHRE